MTFMIVLRIVFALILTAFLAGNLSMQDARERDSEIEPKKSRYLPFLPVGILPMVLGIYVLILWYQHGVQAMAENMLAICFTILIQLSLYTAFLMMILPRLRRRLRPSTCAILWMLPNDLYLCIGPNYGITANEPGLVLRLPGNWFYILGALWFAGFAAVMLWGIFSHLRFRRKILSPARPVTEPEILELLEQERDHAGQRKRRYRLVRSPAAGTPLTIGLLSRSTRIVLPERTYTPEELRLILRHEMVHIGRGDSEAKFYLLFCTALGWWNPLMWIARRRSADDLELSCDETVLRSMDSDCRRPYAELLLRTAGDQQGFTTCLSASAGALRYRLRQVMEPGKRARGIVTMAAAFTLLMLTVGTVTVGYLPKTGEDLLLNGARVEHVTVDRAYNLKNSWGIQYYHVADEVALRQYLSEQEVYQVSTFLYSFYRSSEDTFLALICRGEGEQWSLTLYGDYIQYVPSRDAEQTQCYYSPGVLDGLLQLGILEVDEEFT